jgi:hypothetical protein
MTDVQHSLLKASDINSMDAFEFHHPLNPNSEIYLRFLERAVGLKRIGVTIARVPPGKESFIYHAHHNEEEWVYILSGRGRGGNWRYRMLPLNQETSWDLGCPNNPITFVIHSMKTLYI